METKKKKRLKKPSIQEEDNLSFSDDYNFDVFENIKNKHEDVENTRYDTDDEINELVKEEKRKEKRKEIELEEHCKNYFFN